MARVENIGGGIRWGTQDAAGCLWLLGKSCSLDPCSSDTYCVPVLLFTTQQKKYFTEKLP